MGIGIVPAGISVYHMHAWCLQKPKEDIRAPGTGTTAGCELPCGNYSNSHVGKETFPKFKRLNLN